MVIEQKHWFPPESCCACSRPHRAGDAGAACQEVFSSPCSCLVCSIPVVLLHQWLRAAGFSEQQGVDIKIYKMLLRLSSRQGACGLGAGAVMAQSAAASHREVSAAGAVPWGGSREMQWAGDRWKKAGNPAAWTGRAGGPQFLLHVLPASSGYIHCLTFPSSLSIYLPSQPHQ